MIAMHINYDRPRPPRRDRDPSLLRLVLGVLLGLTLIAVCFVASAMLGNF